uniref:Ig-like domain-containing protein n=1 Tax=Junco hyemalis TaxID=40217 RepID=A0A8C5J978_JUNHY
MVGSKPLTVQVVKQYSRSKDLAERWQVQGGLLEPCPPLFVQEIKPQEAVEGQRCAFSCLFHGRPQPTVTWYNNDKPVGRIQGTAVHTTGCCSTLTFPSVLPQHGGTVTCVIFNPLGTVSTSAGICVRRRMPAYQYAKKEKEEMKFSPDKKSMVVSLDVLPLALLEQAAGLAAGENEDVKIDFQVTEMPPRFAVPVTDIKVAEGLDAVFECVVTGTPVPVVQWFRGDACATPGTGKYVVSQKEGLHSLKVKNVGPSDSGLYRCQATNRLGEATCKGSLVVMAQHEANAVNSETVTGCEPHRSQKCDLLLSTTVSPGDQSEIELEFEFEPHKDGSEKAIQLLAVTQQEQEVEGEKHVNINFDVFAEPSEEERVEFRAEDSESCSFEFQVTEAPPRFVRLISDYSTFVGASVSFQCLVTGSPCPSVRWYKDGVLLEGDRYCAQEEQNGLHSLTIENLVQSDSGQYKCVATNRAGTAETSVNKKIRLECQVDEDRKVTVGWTKDGNKIPPGKDYKIYFEDKIASLEIPLAKVKDSGHYVCTASNEAGSSSSSASVTVRGKIYFSLIVLHYRPW